ncbi:DUF1996 domain-containing protein [Streptomyces virginiae]|uniref:DUF1996 domain-containing protein n=1 Tax=Streptomyces virginiae TaxID=1961 RepID=UPI003686D534
MSKKGHKRPRLSNKVLGVISALVLGGGGVAVVAGNASAGQNDRAIQTIDCPDVGEKLTAVPEQAKPEVDANLAKLDDQVADAYKKLAAGQAKGNALLGDLKQKRDQTIKGMSDAMGRAGQAPADIKSLSACTMKDAPAADAADAKVDAASKGEQGAVAQAAAQKGGPSRNDFVNITKIKPNVRNPRQAGNASKGSFTSQCGRNENGHFNPDNVIVAPGVSNGAHHMHDYVGNLTADAFSTNNSLAASGTTCRNGDQSTYYWPVLRLRDGKVEKDAKAPGGGQDGNVGTILKPKQVSLTFKGSPVGKVTAMPRFMRVITGDAKAFTNGNANANASWSCTGFENRQLKDKYPVCPKGSDVVRTFNFQSCFDGKNVDSANHRTHVAFADKNGKCPNGFKAMPQLVMRLTYGVAPGARFAVDSFPEQLHKPVTDHGDFINVMSNGLMNKAVNCINNGQNCR